jgi:uracil-DNA glycosylase
MTWEEFLNKESKLEYFKNLMTFINNEYSHKTIYPDRNLIFDALNKTPLNKVKVVIIGQDPYHSPGYANGLAFSVCDNVEIPKSLVNIFKEINMELGINIPDTGNLQKWAENGVLLLNRILTVEKGKPLSHKGMGWEIFTNNVLKLLNEQNQKIVFLLFGKSAEELKIYLNNPNHLVLITSHPSPLGAYKGFIGSGVFKKTIEYLDESIDFWRVK